MIQAVHESLDPALVPFIFGGIWTIDMGIKPSITPKVVKLGDKLETQFKNAAELYQHLFNKNGCREMKELQVLIFLIRKSRKICK